MPAVDVLFVDDCHDCRIRWLMWFIIVIIIHEIKVNIFA